MANAANTAKTAKTEVTSQRNIALVAARVAAGLLGLMGLSGSIFFILIAPEETPWLGPWIDVPTVALSLTTGLLLLTVALAPAMPVRRRVTLGFVATGLGVLFNLINITAYDEPEAVTFLVVDAVLALLLGLAWRGASYAGAGPAD